MDPNSNPTPSNIPAPEPNSTPEATGTGFDPSEISAINPEAVVSATNEGPALENPAVSATPVAPAAVTEEPVAEVNSAAPVAPVDSTTPADLTTPVAPATPVNSAAPVEPATPSIAPEPVAQAPVSPTPAAPAPAPATPMEPAVNPAFRPASESISATEPITRPEPMPTMTPEEKELAAPITAAGPVPGSIGSAISMPSGAQPQSVTFNDPAADNAAAQNNSMNAMAMPGMNKAKSGKVMLFGKEVDKKTLIVTGVLAGILIIVLVIILIMQLSA